MNRLFNILLVVVGTALLNLACSREDAPEGSVPDYTRVELALDMGAMTRVGEEANNKIEDVTVWAYEVESGVGASAVVKETPSGWATRTYDGSSPLYIELPYDAYNAHKYRFVAVLNKSRFGAIYKPESNTPQPLEERTHYTDLTHAVFQTDELIGYTAEETGIAPTTNGAVPMSHWKDVEIGAGVTKLTDGDAPTITVYRALAKTQFSARLHKNSSENAALKITSVTVHSASGGASAYKIARQGFLVSALSTDDHLAPNPLPKAFGGYRDLATEVPEIGLINTAGNKALDVYVTQRQPESDDDNIYDFVGSTFLYENHHSMANINSASTTSHADYTVGIYYMEVQYEYGETDGVGGISGKPKQGVNYVPLPSIVRNRDYRVKATFDVQLAGVVNLGYVINDWEDGGTDVLDFTYPTFTVEAVATYDHDGIEVPYYGKPTAYYDGGNDGGAFAFKFQATAPLNKDYTVTAVNSDNNYPFTVAIYKNGTDKLNTTSFTVTDANDYYTIKVYPREGMPTGDGVKAPSCRVAITHTASWTNVTSGLLINTTTGGTRWADSGDDRHSIVVTQVANPTPAQ